MPTAAEAARAAAAHAAAAGGVVVREVGERPELDRVCALFREIWAEDVANATMTPVLLHALAHAGNYVSAAERAGELVGACVGFFGTTDDGWELHSHIAGVTAAARGHSVGFALKTHQRAWALRRGVDRVSWTYDPLVRRNAHFNLGKLAARPRAYLENFYGAMDDVINAGDETDRLVAQWDLCDPKVTAACAGRPTREDAEHLLAAGAEVALHADDRGRPVVVATDASTALVAVPADVERLRGEDRGCAAAWRHAVREVLGGRMAAGGTVIGFAPPGWYVVRAGRR